MSRTQGNKTITEGIGVPHGMDTDSGVWSQLTSMFDRLRVYERPVLILAAAVLTALTLLPLWAVRFPPLQDYPNHLMRIYMILHQSDPLYGYDRLVDVSLFPVPYILVDYLTLALSTFLPLETAGKLVLSLCAIMVPASTFYFVRAFGNDKTPLGFFGFLFAYNWHFNMGFVSFALSISFFLFALGYWWRIRHTLRAGELSRLSVLVLLVYLSHLYTFGYLLCALILMSVIELRSLRGLLRTLLTTAPSLLLFAAAIARDWPTFHTESGIVLMQYPSFWETLRIAFNDYFISFRSYRESHLLIAAGLLALVLTFKIHQAQRALLLLVLMFITLYFVLPEFVAPEYNYFSCRVLILVVLVAVGLLSLPTGTLPRMAVLSVLIALSTASLLTTLSEYKSIDPRLRDFHAALERIPAGAHVGFTMSTDKLYVGHITPYALFISYYYMEKSPIAPAAFGDCGVRSGFYYKAGGSSPPLKGFIGPIRSVSFKNPMDGPHFNDQVLKSELSRSMVGLGGYTVIVGRKAMTKVDPLARRYGYRMLFHIGNIFIYRRDKLQNPASNMDSLVSDKSVPDEVNYWVVMGRMPPWSGLEKFKTVFKQGPVRLLALAAEEQIAKGEKLSPDTP